MATPEECKIVGNALRGLCGTLQQPGKTAWDTADRVFLELELPEDDHKGGRAHLARHVLRRGLRRATDLDGWHLPRGCTPNSELKLCRDTMTLKILRPGFRRDSVPHPGPNRARMYYYRNPLLNLYDADGSNLIGVWTIDKETGEFHVRVVRPTKPWKALGREDVDIDFILPDSSVDLESLEFIPSDEAIPLPFEFDENEGEEGGHVGPIGG
ncbi:MAG: hypothetical protein ACRDSP_10390 [Pseudonocardiaceae bacterium]